MKRSNRIKLFRMYTWIGKVIGIREPTRIRKASNIEVDYQTIYEYRIIYLKFSFSSTM